MPAGAALPLASTTAMRGVTTVKRRPRVAPMALFAAARIGDVAQVRRILAHMRAVEANEHRQKGRGAVVKLEHPVAGQSQSCTANATSPSSVPRLIDTRGPGSLPAIQFAAEFGFSRVVQTLLFEGGAKPDTTDAEGRTALHRAAANGHVQCLQLLLRALALRQSRGLRMFASWASAYSIGDESPRLPPRAVSLICAMVGTSTAAAVDALHCESPLSRRSALMMAAEAGHVACIRELLRAKAHVHIPDPTGWNAVELALKARQQRAVDVLWMRAHAPQCPATNGPPHVPPCRDLVVAASRPGTGAASDHSECIKFLVKCKASPNVPKRGRTAMSMAVQHNNIAAAKVLLAAGGHADHLSLAAAFNHVAMVQLLCQSKADVNRVGWTGPRPSTATNGGAQKPEHLPPLLAAARRRHTEVALLLLEAKADPTLLSFQSKAVVSDNKFVHRLQQDPKSVLPQNNAAAAAKAILSPRNATSIRQGRKPKTESNAALKGHKQPRSDLPRSRKRKLDPSAVRDRKTSIELRNKMKPTPLSVLQPNVEADPLQVQFGAVERTPHKEATHVAPEMAQLVSLPRVDHRSESDVDLFGDGGQGLEVPPWHAPAYEDNELDMLQHPGPDLHSNLNPSMNFKIEV